MGNKLLNCIEPSKTNEYHRNRKVSDRSLVHYQSSITQIGDLFPRRKSTQFTLNDSSVTSNNETILPNDEKNSMNKYDRKFKSEQEKKYFKKSTEISSFSIHMDTQGQNDDLYQYNQQILCNIKEQLQNQQDKYFNLQIQNDILTQNCMKEICDYMESQQFYEIKLNLSQTQMDDFNLILLSDALYNQENLEVLHLDFQFNNLSNEGVKYFFSSLIKLLLLKELSIKLGGNQLISGSSLNELNNSLQYLCSIQILNIDLMLISLKNSDLFILEFSRIIIQIPLHKLSLDFSQTKIGHTLLQALTRDLRECYLLENLNLNLSYNNLNQNLINQLQQTLLSLHRIKKIKLQLMACSLCIQDYEKLLIGISSLKCLQSLSINFTSNYAEQNSQQFMMIDYIDPENSFQKLKKFKLSLAHCQLNSDNAENFLLLLISLRNIQVMHLNLINTKIENEINFISEVKKMSKIEKLVLDVQNLQITGIEELVLCKNMKHLTFNSNNNYFDIQSLFKKVKDIHQLVSLQIQCLLKNDENTEELVKQLYKIPSLKYVNIKSRNYSVQSLTQLHHVQQFYSTLQDHLAKRQQFFTIFNHLIKQYQKNNIKLLPQSKFINDILQQYD